MTAMFKPPFDDLRAAFCHHAQDVGNLVGFEAVIESKGEVIQPKRHVNEFDSPRPSGMLCGPNLEERLLWQN